MNAMLCNTSLHKWKDEIRRVTNMDMQCRRLLECLRDAVDATKQAAPRGKPGPHPLTRDQRQHLDNCHSRLRECHWEEAIWRKYGNESSDLLPGLWARILSYQVMLRNDNVTDAEWGEIDLLGVNANGSPVVVELKSDICREAPLRMLLEGYAYGIALQSSEIFASGFQQRIGKTRITAQHPSSQYQEVPIVCLAPSSYWRWCFGIKDKPVRAAWPAISKLIEAMTLEGFPAIFAEIRHDGRDVAGLPNIKDVIPIQLPI